MKWLSCSYTWRKSENEAGNYSRFCIMHEERWWYQQRAQKNHKLNSAMWISERIWLQRLDFYIMTIILNIANKEKQMRSILQEKSWELWNMQRLHELYGKSSMAENGSGLVYLLEICNEYVVWSGSWSTVGIKCHQNVKYIRWWSCGKHYGQQNG